MKYYRCSKCGKDSQSKSGMMQHAFNELIQELETSFTLQEKSKT